MRTMLKTGVLLAATILLVVPALAQKGWKRFEQEVPFGKVEVRPWEPTPSVWSTHPYGQWVRPAIPWRAGDNDPYYPPGFPHR